MDLALKYFYGMSSTVMVFLLHMKNIENWNWETNWNSAKMRLSSKIIMQFLNQLMLCINWYEVLWLTFLNISYILFFALTFSFLHICDPFQNVFHICLLMTFFYIKALKSSKNHENNKEKTNENMSSIKVILYNSENLAVPFILAYGILSKCFSCFL